MKRVVISGLGLVTSIGNGRAAVLDSLRTGRTGIEIHPELDRPEIPIKLAGTIKGFQVDDPNPRRWQFPAGLDIPWRQLRSMPPHAVYGYAAMLEAIADAALPASLVTDERTGMLCASAGSAGMQYRNTDKMRHEGIERCHPLSVAQSIAGTLNFNLTAAFGIRGASGGFVSACASSAHAFGTGLDLIRLGRQDVMFIVGAEDCDYHSILPFASCRALTTATDPTVSPCAFDRKRDGFAGSGGATVIVLEEYEHARARGATLYAEAAGWGQTSDGYDVIAPEPDGKGLARAMRLALADAGWQPEQVDYVNAHATSTPVGDRAELRALKDVFGTNGSPLISSTKSQTGHTFSAAGAMEAAFCCLAIKERFTPMSINVTEPDEEAEGLSIVSKPTDQSPQRAISNSSGFGGVNVVLAFQRVE
jgi:3-oxoacyl-[acyl-carrier-protein] synthase-1